MKAKKSRKTSLEKLASEIPDEKKKKPKRRISNIIRSVIHSILYLFYPALYSIRRSLTMISDMVISGVLWGVNAIITIFSAIARFLQGFMTSVSKKLGTLTPSHIKDRIQKLIIYSGITKTIEEIVGMTMIYAAAFAIVAFLSVYYLLAMPTTVAIAASIGAIILVVILMYTILTLLADRRTQSIEMVLPDILQMIAQNMSAGMTPYNALWVSARPEFGPFADEIQRAARDTLAGKPLSTALDEMKERVDSDKLKRAVRLMIQGMESGGELPTVLQEIAADMREEHNLEVQMRSETGGYAMFIMFALLIGAPLLLAVSITFISIFSQIFEEVGVSDLTEQMGMSGGSAPISMEKLSITPEFFRLYSVGVLGISAFFGSFLIGIVRTGRAKGGIKYIPVLISLAIVIFLGLCKLLTGFFGGMLS